MFLFNNVFNIKSDANFLLINTITLFQNMPPYKTIILERKKVAHFGDNSTVMRYKGVFHHVYKFCWRNIGGFKL